MQSRDDIDYSVWTSCTLYVTLSFHLLLSVEKNKMFISHILHLHVCVLFLSSFHSRLSALPLPSSSFCFCLPRCTHDAPSGRSFGAARQSPAAFNLLNKRKNSLSDEAHQCRMRSTCNRSLSLTLFLSLYLPLSFSICLGTAFMF